MSLRIFENYLPDLTEPTCGESSNSLCARWESTSSTFFPVPYWMTAPVASMVDTRTRECWWETVCIRGLTRLSACMWKCSGDREREAFQTRWMQGDCHFMPHYKLGYDFLNLINTFNGYTYIVFTLAPWPFFAFTSLISPHFLTSYLDLFYCIIDCMFVLLHV